MSESGSRAETPAWGARDQIFEDHPNLIEIQSRVEEYLEFVDPIHPSDNSNFTLGHTTGRGRIFENLTKPNKHPLPNPFPGLFTAPKIFGRAVCGLVGYFEKLWMHSCCEQSFGGSGKWRHAQKLR